MKTFEQSFNIGGDKIIIEADKTVGYVCINKSDLFDQYSKINKQQHFGSTCILEEWYIKSILNFILEAKAGLPHELSNIIKETDFLWENKVSEIGVLRLQPKVLKLEKINASNVQFLTSRGIKSSMRDPIKIIQKILDEIFNHLLFHTEQEFIRKFGFISPSVTGVQEAISRIKQTKTGDWGNSIELEGDFSDLYSKCNCALLTECVKQACLFSKFHESSFQYIRLLINCIMNHSYFKEPNGIFKTLKGFSMGDCSAARGSEIILRIYEIKMFSVLARNNLIKTVKRFLRFRDDVSIHLTGSDDEIKKAVKIIGSGYPPSLKFNMESKIIYGKFLNIRIYNDPHSSKPFTTVLRKENNKYNIIPPNSNTHQKYKKMAGLSYFKTARTHSSSEKELRNQYRVIHTILECKKFTEKERRKIQKTEPKTSEPKKRFLSKTIYDEVSKRHKFVHKIFKKLHIDKDKYYAPGNSWCKTRTNDLHN